MSEKPFQEAFIRELKARDALIRDLKQRRAPPSPYLMDAMARVLRHLTEAGHQSLSTMTLAWCAAG